MNCGALETGDLSLADPEVWAQTRLKNAAQISESDLQSLFGLLPKDEVRGGSREVRSAFVTGCYAQGGFRGLRKECHTFPFASRIMTRFVKERLPGHVFSTCGFFSNSATPLHKDGRNAPWPNALFRVTDFQGGGLWIEGPGDDARVSGQLELSGSVHELTSEPLVFDAWSNYHQTEPWTGNRLVLVTWVIQQLGDFGEAELARARGLGFLLPPEVPFPLETSQTLARPPCAFELFAGKGSLSRALRQTGFHVHSFDHHHCDSCVPVAQLDLSSEVGQNLFWDLMKKHPPFLVHLGLPCGTSSKARGRPLPNGEIGPSPLRSRDFPLGLPSLQPGSVDSCRVDTANRLYAFGYRVLRYCLDNSIIVCIENPRNSFLWEILAAFEPSEPSHRLLPRLSEVCFDQCCHGGSRPKGTKLLCSPECFESLRASCPGNHLHKAWGRIVECGSVRFATKDEAAYPCILAQRYSLCVAQRWRRVFRWSPNPPHGVKLCSSPADSTADMLSCVGVLPGHVDASAVFCPLASPEASAPVDRGCSGAAGPRHPSGRDHPWSPALPWHPSERGRDHP